MIKKANSDVSTGIYTTVMVKKTTRDRLLTYGNMGDTYDSLILKTLDRIDKINGEEPQKKGKNN